MAARYHGRDVRDGFPHNARGRPSSRMISSTQDAKPLRWLRAPSRLWSGGGAASVEDTRPVDRFTPLPTDLSMRDLRQVAALARPTPARHVDINDIRFGIEIEMMGADRAAAAKRFLWMAPRWMGWKPRFWQVEEDESLGSHGAEAVSPPMKLNHGSGQGAIRKAFQIMHDCGGMATQRCGLHIHVDASVLGERGLANLMQIALENEALLFRISQNGHPQHRGLKPRHGIEHYYAKPFSTALHDDFNLVHAETPNEFRNALYGAIPPNYMRPLDAVSRPSLPPVDSKRAFRPDRRDAARYFGLNFNSYWYRGTIEFRLFDATDDPEQAIAMVELVLGMVKAAADGDYAYLQQNPLGNNRADVSSEQFDYFLSKVAPDPKLRQRLTWTFQQSGGYHTADARKNDSDLMQIVCAMQNGYRFQAEGKALSSPLEAQNLLRSYRHALHVVKPDGSPPLAVAGSEGLQALVREASQQDSAT